MRQRDARPLLWKLLIALPVGLAILGCAGGATDAADGDAATDAEEGDDDDGDDDDDDDDDDLPDNVDEEKSGRWIPAKGFTFELAVDSGGDDRSALVHVPKKDKRKELPLVITFHGGKSDAKRMGRYFEDHANEGVVFAFPIGLDGGERAWAGPGDDRDLDFVADLIDELDERVGIDRDHVYATGFSHGAGFVWSLQCEREQLFAGFGHVSQAMAKDVKKSCKPKGHKPFVWVHGDSDKKAPWKGTKEVLGVDETLQWWLERHRCRKTQDRRDWMPDIDKEDGTHPELYRYESCKDVPALHLYKVKGGVHAWPSMKGVGKKGDGRSRDMDATEAMLAFWKQHAGLEWSGGED